MKNNNLKILKKNMKEILILMFLFLFTTSCNENTETKKKDNLIEKKEMKEQKYMEQFFAQISVSNFKKEIENPDIILLDVRTPWELPVYWKIRENQKLIDINSYNFVSEIAKLDKTKKYLIYCWHWNRSVTARNYMKREWFSYVKDLEWWIDKWILQGEKVFK